MLVRILAGAILLLGSLSLSAQQPINPNFFYFTQGQTPDTWQWVLADPGNWWQPIEDAGGKSGGGKVTLSSAGSEQFPGAIKLQWGRGDSWGSATISGREVDLSRFEHSAELVVALKVESRVPGTVNIKLACGEDCEAEVNVADNLKKLPRGQWMVLPLPLDCFASAGLDLSKVSSPFSVGTQGRFELHIAEISLAPMAEGDEGCVPNDAAGAAE
ncbi:MAG TPA: putative glycoside hydrolase [Cellvibrionaceae bacterium]